MSDETNRSYYIDNEGTALKWLKIIKNDESLTNLTLKFCTSSGRKPLDEESKQQRADLFARLCEALKVNHHIRELSLFHVDDLRRVNEILESNETITKLAIHARNDDGNNGPAANFDAIRCLLKHGTQIEMHFTWSGGLDFAKFADEIPENSTLTSLTLAYCDLGEQAVQAICNAVKRCSALSKLDLSDNSLTIAAASAIGDMLRNNSTLTNLVLKSCTLKGCLEPICDGLRMNSVLKKLDIAHNGIKRRSGVYIAKVLRENSTLAELCISGNKMSKFEIFDALKQNTTLTKFEYDFDENFGSRRRQLKASAAEMMRRNSGLIEMTILGDDCEEHQRWGTSREDESHEDRHFDYVDYEAGTFECALAGNQTLRVLDLSGSMLSNERVEDLGHALKSNISLVCLKFCVYFDDDSPCEKFCEGLKANGTLKTLWLDETVWNSDLPQPEDVGAIAIAGALAVNTGLEKVTMKGNNFSSECLELLAVGLERNNTLKELELNVEDLDDDQARLLVRGLVLNTSLKSFDINLTEAECLAESLTSNIANMTFEELKIRLPHSQVQDELVTLANALKVNISLKRLWLLAHLTTEGPGTKALMEAYMHNAALKCEILDYDSGECGGSCFYYRLNRTGRLSWPDSTFPALLWPRALVLADMRSSPERPDLLFHFIVAKPDMFKDYCCEGRNRNSGSNKKARTDKLVTQSHSVA